MLKWAVTIVLAAAAVLASVTILGQVGSAATAPVNSSVWNEWVQAYRMVAEISKAGMNVSIYTDRLREALEMIKEGNSSGAREILESVMPQLREAYLSKDNYVLTSTIKRYALASVVLATPLIFYYVFPRVYLEIWYRARKKWVIKE